MSELTRKQARLMQRQIRKLYGRNYIPVVTSDSTLSIGDILLKKKDTFEEIDSSVFNPKNVKFVEGRKVNKNISSSSSVSITTKLNGSSLQLEHFDVEEAGLIVEFDSKNQMFLKVLGLRQQSMKNFVDFRKELFSKFVSGELSAKVYVVSGLVYADKYYLQYSGSRGGVLGLGISSNLSLGEGNINGDFFFKWNRDVGYSSNGEHGGVLAYRVSAVRLKRHLIPEYIHDNILKGMSESDALDMVAFKERQKLFDEDAFEIVDSTDEVLLYHV